MGHLRRNLYALTRTKYRDVYIGVATIYDYPYLKQDPPYTADRLAPYFVASRDGVKFDFEWIRHRTPLIPHGDEHSFDHGVIIPAADILTVGGYHWLYYAGYRNQHEQIEEGEAKIGLARWPEGRLVHLTVGPDAEEGVI